MSKKGFSVLKQKKWTPHIFYIILHIQISLVKNISSNWQFWFFGTNLPQMVFPVENRKSEHRYGILHIWISLGTNFQLKLIILSFWTKITLKRYFQVKTEQAVQELQAFAFCVENVNSTAIFKHFKDLKISLFWTLVNSKLLVKSWLNFDLNFGFKFLYNFTGQLKKLKLLIVMEKSFDKYHHLFNLPIFVTILLFNDWDSSILKYKGTLT